MKAKKVILLMLSLLCLLVMVACGWDSDKQPADDKGTTGTPTGEVETPRTTLKIGVAMSKEWLTPYIEGFEEAQSTYRIELETFPHYCNEDNAKAYTSKVFLETVRVDEVDAFCATKEIYEALQGLIPEMPQDQWYDYYQNMFQPVDGRDTKYETSEYVTVMLNESKNAEGVCAFLDYLREHAE